MSFGVDVSHHQDPTRVPWESIGTHCRFVICRTTYGTRRDRRVAEHARRVRAAGCELGVYHFYRSTESAAAQFEAFCAAANAVGYGHGDIAPAIDIEDDPHVADVSPAWEPELHEFVKRVEAEFGGCLLYLTQRDWHRLGRPKWILDRPLWVAHFTARPEPFTPDGRPWLIWQYRVGPLDPFARGGYVKARPELDHNRASGPLPRVRMRSEELPPDTEDSVPWALLRAQVVDTQGRLLHDLIGDD